jgi:hypothetical protein
VSSSRRTSASLSGFFWPERLEECTGDFRPATHGAESAFSRPDRPQSCQARD